MGYKIQFDFNDSLGWRNVEVLVTDFTYTQVVHKNLKPADNSIKGELVPNDEILDLMRGAGNNEIFARLLDDDNNPLFTGYLRKSFKIVKTQRLQPVSFEIVSPTNRLKRKNRNEIFFNGMKVCDPSNVSNSITHQLLYSAGFRASEIGTLPEIDVTLALVNVPPDSEEYSSIMYDLLYPYGYILDFDHEAKAVLVELLPAYRDDGQVFNGSNCLNEIQQSKKEEAADVVEVHWKQVRTLSQQPVFSDSTDASSQNKCNIIVPPGKFLGEDEGGRSWYAEFGLDGKEFLAAFDCTLDIKHDDDIVVREFEPGHTRAKLSIENTSAVFERKITKLDILGRPIVQLSVDVSRVVNSDTDNVKQFKTKYVYAKADADWLASRLAQYYKFSDFLYKVQSKVSYPIGSFVTLTDEGMGTANCRIIQKVYHLQTGHIEYLLEGVTEYEAQETEFDHVQVYQERPRADDIIDVSDFVTHEELSNTFGYVTLYTRSTTPPEQPVGNSPEGWARTVPNGSGSVWMVGGQTDSEGNITEGGWSAPARFGGADAVYVHLSNEQHAVPVDIEGSNPDLDGAHTTVTVFEGGVDTTSLWTIGYTESDGLSGTWDPDTYTYTVTSITKKAASVEFELSRSSRSPIRRTFSLTMARPGPAGDAIPTYRIELSTSVVYAYSDGSYLPPNGEIMAHAWKRAPLGNSEKYEGIFVIVLDGVESYRSEAPTDTLLWANDFSLYPSDYLHPRVDLLPQIPNPYQLDKDVVIATLELWSADGELLLDSQSIAFIRDVSFKMNDIVEASMNEVSRNTPKYLGRFLDSVPTEYVKGDWYLLYGEDDEPYQRGIYVIQEDYTAQRITGDESANARYMAAALFDVTWAANNGYGDFADYGNITFIANLATNALFTSALQIGIDQVAGLENLGSLAFNDAVELAQLGSTVIRGGYLRTELLDVDHILGESAVFRGTLEATEGLFRGSIESGPLYLNVEPPVSTSFTTNGKTLKQLYDYFINNGVNPGTYQCSGTYAGQVANKITFTRSNKYERDTGNNHSQKWHTGIWPFRTKWQRDYSEMMPAYDYSVRIERDSTVIAKLSGRWDAGPSYWSAHGGKYKKGNGAHGPWGSPNSPPSTPNDTGDRTPKLANGTLSFTSEAFTMRMINMPAYNSSLPRWTVYLESDGDGDFVMKVKGY